MASVGAIERRLTVGICASIHGLKTQPEHNFKSCHLECFIERTGRWRVRLASGKILAVKPGNLLAVQLTADGPAAPWENCRHGGPAPNPGMMQFVHTFCTSPTFLRCTAPCLQHAMEMEPLIRRFDPPASIVASMGVDAFIASDFKHVQSCLTLSRKLASTFFSKN
mmetsp:Transcript_38050/g.74533  ORF Transcript_38050/g.74533 Transcript_38050/m.74533 type:complete len:166 (+) Transcript_38050:35-532(+)